MLTRLIDGGDCMPEIKHLLLAMAVEGADFYNSNISDVIHYYGVVTVLEAEMFLVNNCMTAVKIALGG